MFQELKVADDLFAGIDAATRRAMIRTGHRDIREGELLLRGVTYSTLARQVHVHRVKHIKLRELSDEDARGDGAANAQEMVALLSRYHPDVTPDSDITVVLFETASLAAPGA